MEQFLARISDDLMILDYAHQKKIDGRAFKQDILCAMRTIEPYSRILLAQNNCYRWIVVFCACLCAGKRLHILDGAEDLQKKAAPIEADLLIGHGGANIEDLLRFENIPTDLRKQPPINEGHIYLYTTGTASESRPVLFRGRQMADTACVQAEALGIQKNDTVALLPPFSHAYGLSALLSALQSAGQVVILRDSLTLLKYLRSGKTDGLFVQPAMLGILADYPTVTDKLKSLRFLACAGAKLDAAIHERYQKQGIPVVNIYGATETGMCFMGATRTEGKAGHFFVSACMEFCLDADGELLVRGSNIGRNGETDAPLEDAEGWYHTGDLAQRNSDGSFSIVGRKGSVVILNSGYKINIEQLEKKVAALLNVEDCQILVQTFMGVDQLVLILCDPMAMDLQTLNQNLHYYENIARVKRVGKIRKNRGKKIRMNKERILREIAHIMEQIAPEKKDWDRSADGMPFFKAMEFGSLTSLQFIISMEKNLGVVIDILEFDPEFTLDQLVAFFMEQSVSAQEGEEA